MRSSRASALSILGLLACSGAPPSDLLGPNASAANDMQGGDNERATDASAGDAWRSASSSPAADGGRSESGSISESGTMPVPGAMPGSAQAAEDAATPVSNSPKGVAFVQIATSTPPSFALSAAATFLNAQIAGSLNVVAVGWEDSTAQVADVSDLAGNAYRLAVGPTGAGGLSQSIYYASGIAASAAGNAVQVRFVREVPRIDLRVAEYSGLDGAMPLDVVAALSGEGTMATSGAATTTAASELVFGAGTSTDTFSEAGSLFVLRTLTGDGNLVEDRVVSGPGAYSADAVLPYSVNWVMQVATFQ